METVPCYKLRQKQKPNLFPPPEYCRLHEKRDPTRFEEHKLFTKLEVSDPGKLMGLCESLVHPTSQQLEAKINSYLKEELDAEDVFIITILTESEEAIVQVIGKCLRLLQSVINLSSHIIKRLKRLE